MGTGKTLITLELLKYWHQCGKMRKGLVFITSDKAFPTWEKQIKRYDIDLPYTLLEGGSREKWEAFEEFGNEGLVFVSYPGAVHLVSVEIKEKRKKAHWELSKPKVQKLAHGLDAFVMDESTRASGHGSLTHWLMRELGKTANIRYALAGRPFGRDPTLLWAQHYLIDRGETLGETLGLFRGAFFNDTPNKWVAKNRQKYIRNYSFDQRHNTKLARMIQHRSISYAADECIELPKLVSILDPIKFTGEASAYYKRAVDTLIKSKGNMREIRNLFMRMRQLSSGFVGFVDDDTGERAQVDFDENPKLDRLVELLDNLPADRKAVVFYEFTYSGRKIAAEAEKLKLKPIWLWSGTKDYKKDAYNFENNPAYRVAVVNNKVGALSLDYLSVANYCFFYESPVSNIDREQAERRLLRQGQKRKVFQYDLIVEGSMDAKILAYHKEGQSLLEALLRDPALVRKK